MTTNCPVAPNSLDELLNSGITLPPLPAVGVRLLRMARQPIDQIDVHKLAGMVDTDPSLALRVLKLANSSFYSPVNEVTNLGQALMLIGPQEAVQTLSYFVLSNSMPRIKDLDHFCLDDFWAHSWACAMAARMLCHPANGIHALPGDLYLAGLLHGVGKLALAQALPGEFDKCLFEANQSGRPLHIVEREQLGYTETELAQRLLQSWELPESIRLVIGNYPDPGVAPDQQREQAAVLQFAQIVANMSGIGSTGVIGETDLDNSWLVNQGTSPLAWPELREKALTEIMATFRKRAMSIVGAGVNLGEAGMEDPDLAAEADQVGPKRSKSSPQPKTSVGFFGKIKKVLSSLFG